MKKQMLLLLSIIWLFGNGCQASIPLSPEDRIILTRFFEYARQHKLTELPAGERIAAIGSFFIGTPYQSGTLETNTTEQLVVNLREFDCVTFVDHVLALAFLNDYTPENIPAYLDNLQEIRYWEGKITDYTARLHYSSDWLHEMTRTGRLSDVTRENGGVPFPNRVGFISNNYQKYPALKKDSTLVTRIIEIENNINSRNYYYIPKNQVDSRAGQLKSGDIILITTHVKGLDTSHVGIAVEKNGEIRLLHASTSTKQVNITEIPLSTYLQGIKSHSGILVGRIF